MTEWAPQLSKLGKPRYLAIADAIAEDIRSGKLSPADRLPAQRTLARRLDVDFTTVARGYVEAQRRGLIESRVGQGTFVRASVRRRHGPVARHPEIVDLSMNLPPEPDDPELLDRMQDGLEAIGSDLVYLMRYQGFGGVAADKDAAAHWLRHRELVPQHERLFIAPGAHPALLGILGVVAKAGRCAALGRSHLSGRALDRGAAWPAPCRAADGRRRRRCARVRRRLRTLIAARALPQSDLTQSDDAHDRATTPPRDHRQSRAATASRSSKTIHMAFCRQRPSAFAALAPDITWHVAGLAKCLGAGLRIAYVVAPDVRSGWLFASSVRTATVMASPVTIALATRWINDGTADALLAAVRRESIARQKLAAAILPAGLTAPIRSAFTSGCRCRSPGPARRSSATPVRPA